MENATQGRKFKIFVALAYFITWLIWLPLALNDLFKLRLPTFPYQHFVGSFGPFAASLLTVLFFDRFKGLMNFLKRSFNFRIKYYWYLFALSCPLVFYLIGVLILFIVRGHWIDISQIGVTKKLSGFGVASVWAIWILTYGLGEETGWRGFLMPLLNKKYSFTKSVFIVAIVWAFWHLPAFFYNPGFKTMGFAIIGWAVGLLFGSFLLGWISKNTNWSVIGAILFHGTLNTVTASDQAEGLLAGIVSIFVIVLTLLIGKVFGEEIR